MLFSQENRNREFSVPFHCVSLEGCTWLIEIFKTVLK